MDARAAMIVLAGLTAAELRRNGLWVQVLKEIPEGVFERHQVLFDEVIAENQHIGEAIRQLTEMFNRELP